MAGFGQPSRGANMADQRTSCRPSVQLNIIFYQKLLIPS